MRIKALITLAVSASKEIPAGSEYDLNEEDAKHMIELGFAEVIKTAKANPPQNNKPKPQGNNADDTSSSKSSEQPV